jgi:uncharacterized membrane protein (DUF106 family)
MTQRFCSLIVMGPGAPHTIKLNLSRGAIAILVLAFLISFFFVIGVSSFPITINDEHWSELQEENRTLKLETSEAALGIQRLDAKVSELEEKSKRIEELIEPSL